jgi:hypothetical protein
VEPERGESGKDPLMVRRPTITSRKDPCPALLSDVLGASP